MQLVQETVNQVNQVELASRTSRLFARIIDMVIIYAPFLIIAPFENTSIGETLGVVGGLLFFALFILQLVLLTISGQTIGKKILGIKIVRLDTWENGGFVTNILLRGLVNGLASIIPFYSLIDVLFIFSEDYRCLHDKIANTVVVNA